MLQKWVPMCAGTLGICKRCALHISHDAGDVTGASQAGSGSLPVLQATMAPGVAGFSDVALEATKEQEALAVAFLSKCTVGETVLNAYEAAYDQETKCRAFLSAAKSAMLNTPQYLLSLRAHTEFYHLEILQTYSN